MLNSYGIFLWCCSPAGEMVRAGDEKGKNSYMSINDPQWGRNAGSGNASGAEDENRSGSMSDDDRNQSNEDQRREEVDKGESGAQNSRDEHAGDDRKDAPRKGSQENDLDQLWDDFNRMMGSILGGGRPQQRRRHRCHPSSWPHWRPRCPWGRFAAGCGGHRPPRRPHRNRARKKHT